MPKNSIYLALILILLNGCAGGTRWAHNNYSDSQFRSDSKRCENVASLSQQPGFRPSQIDGSMTPQQKASILAQNSGGFLAGGLASAIDSTSIYRECLKILGYRRE
jgi:hypothetical protein